jgi:hypothetical protein
MSGQLYCFLADDHARLDALLQRATISSAEIGCSVYAEFRAGLLKHISMEEKLLLPAARRARGGEPLPLAAKLRLDHGALAALLVPMPTPAIISTQALRESTKPVNISLRQRLTRCLPNCVPLLRCRWRSMPTAPESLRLCAAHWPGRGTI